MNEGLLGSHQRDIGDRPQVLAFRPSARGNTTEVVAKQRSRCRLCVGLKAGSEELTLYLWKNFRGELAVGMCSFKLAHAIAFPRTMQTDAFVSRWPQQKVLTTPQCSVALATPAKAQTNEKGGFWN